MHIPDGLMYPATAAATGVVGAGAVAYALKKSREELDEKRIPVVGLTAAFIFAAQMVTVPVAGGTSAHLLGGRWRGSCSDLGSARWWSAWSTSCRL